MVVFSDLDRSIIYSKRFLGEDKSELEIEIYKNENISYISKKTVKLIKQLKGKDRIYTDNYKKYRTI